VVSNQTGFGKTGKTVMKSLLHPNTTQEKYHYQTEGLHITKGETPDPYRKVNVPLVR